MRKVLAAVLLALALLAPALARHGGTVFICTNPATGQTLVTDEHGLAGATRAGFTDCEPYVAP